MIENPNMGYEGMLPESKEDKKKKRINKNEEASRVYKGELENLQGEYVARKKIEEQKENKRRAIMEERQEMVNRQREKEKLIKEVKELRWKQSKTGQAVGAVKDVAKRSWLITKNVGHQLSVAGGAVMGSLDGHSQHVAKVAQNPIQHIQNVRAQRQMTFRQAPQPAPAKPFNLDAFVNSMVSGTPQPSAQPKMMRSRPTYRKVKERIRVKRGKKWITKTVTKRRKVGQRVMPMGMQPKAQKAFDINDVLRGMPQ